MSYYTNNEYYILGDNQNNSNYSNFDNYINIPSNYDIVDNNNILNNIHIPIQNTSITQYDNGDYDISGYTNLNNKAYINYENYNNDHLEYLDSNNYNQLYGENHYNTTPIQENIKYENDPFVYNENNESKKYYNYYIYPNYIHNNINEIVSHTNNINNHISYFDYNNLNSNNYIYNNNNDIDLNNIFNNNTNPAYISDEELNNIFSDDKRNIDYNNFINYEQNNIENNVIKEYYEKTPEQIIQITPNVDPNKNKHNNRKIIKTNNNINNTVIQEQSNENKNSNTSDTYIINNEIKNENNNLNQNNFDNNKETLIYEHGSNTNVQTPAPVMQRKLNHSDFINIVYKDIGMINLGNTCFINSCLQVLIHCPTFIYKFFNKHEVIKKDDTPVSFNLFALCVGMMNTVNTQEKYIDITNFKNMFGAKHPSFEGYLQNDSQEFCRVLLEDISTELNEVKNRPIYRQLTNNGNKSKIDRDIEFDTNFKEREKSIITDLFYSQLITTFTCQCKKETYSFQKILDFPLLLPENEATIDIKDLLKKYFQTEIIDFESKCENCKKVLKHKKEIKISRPPEILILSLQRIDQTTQKKNECDVTFPPVLNIFEFIDHECGFDKAPLYNLYAVINHHGGMDFGHYFSYIKFNETEDWYEFNDSNVTKIENNIESFPYAYALFYIKNKDTPK